MHARRSTAAAVRSVDMLASRFSRSTRSIAFTHSKSSSFPSANGSPTGSSFRCSGAQIAPPPESTIIALPVLPTWKPCPHARPGVIRRCDASKANAFFTSLTVILSGDTSSSDVCTTRSRIVGPPICNRSEYLRLATDLILSTFPKCRENTLTEWSALSPITRSPSASAISLSRFNGSATSPCLLASFTCSAVTTAAASTSRKNSSCVPPASIHSTISPFGGRSGKRMILIVNSGLSFSNAAATSWPYFSPAGSLSTMIATVANRRTGDQFVFPTASSPPALVVATSPNLTAASVAFSPAHTTAKE